MQTLIVNHYPPVIRQIREIEQIANAEDIEFSKLRLSMNNVSRNMFILTADKTGIQAFEHLFGITPKASQSLEERRTIVLFQANRREMSLSELYVMLSSYLKGVEFAIDKREMKLVITTNVDAGRVEILRNMIEEILPLNAYFLLGYHDTCKLRIKYAAAITFISSCYPQFNRPELFLDNTWNLNGDMELSGYRMDGRVDLYPVGIKLLAAARAAPKEETGIVFLSGAEGAVSSSQQTEMRIPAVCREAAKESVGVQAEAAVDAGSGAVLMDNLNCLDDEWKLDGSRELNGGMYWL